MIGFGGSVVSGRGDIFAHLQPIFEHHPTAPFVTKVKGVLGTGAALLSTIAGMVPVGAWRIALFQNTPPPQWPAAYTAASVPANEATTSSM